MADFDPKFDTTPLNTYGTRGRGASVAVLKAALTTFSASSYSPARLQTMTKLDLAYACKVHNLSTTGL